MAEEDAFDMEAYTTELDQMMANVMPDSWEGHSRLALAEMATDLNQAQLRFAKRLASRMHGKAKPEAVARVSYKKTKEKMSG